jgi:hypothetical protein
MAAKYKGKRLNGIRKPHYHRITDDQVSPIDPDSAPMQLSGGAGSLEYHDQYVVDGGNVPIILSALVVPAWAMANAPFLDLIDWVCSRWRLTPKLETGDAKYGTMRNQPGPGKLPQKKLEVPSIGYPLYWDAFTY